MSDLHITDNLERNRYEVHADGRRLGLAVYELEEDRIIVVHTEVDPSAGGQGVGSQLARFIFDDARERGLAVVPECPFIAHFVDEHPEYADLVDNS